jgi:hypothetical protein
LLKSLLSVGPARGLRSASMTPVVHANLVAGDRPQPAIPGRGRCVLILRKNGSYHG